MQIGNMGRLAAVAAAGLLVLSQAGCSFTDESEIRHVAIKAVKAHPTFPKNGTIGPSGKCSVYAGKSAASALIPFEGANAAGQRESGSYTVWLKRIGNRWELDRCERTPVYRRSL